MNGTDRLSLIRHAEDSWTRGDLKASTATLAALAGNDSPIIHEAAYLPHQLPVGVSSSQLSHNGHLLSSHLTTFDEGIAVFDIGVPLLRDGTFYSQAFAHLKYPERYAHLFSKESDVAIKTIQEQTHRLDNAYITLIRPPYYHWLLDTIPHLLGAGRLGHLADVKLLMSDAMPLKAWQRGLLEKAVHTFGISNLTWQPVNGSIVGVRPGFSQTRMPMADRINVVRSIGPRSPSSKPWRFIYAKRNDGDVRHLMNEEAVIQALSKRFEIIEPGKLDLESQMKIFSEARCVVGVHGSNLTNIAFCRPGTAVVEIMAGLPQPHFEHLCEAAELNFRRVTAAPVSGQAYEEKSAEASTPTWAQAHGDLTVDPAHVIHAIDRTLSG